VHPCNDQQACNPKAPCHFRMHHYHKPSSSDRKGLPGSNKKGKGLDFSVPDSIRLCHVYSRLGGTP
jgi:hypothetical protein